MYHETTEAIAEAESAPRVHTVTVVEETTDDAVATTPPAGLREWDRARHWLHAAVRFDECKLWCQVMLGFELLAINREFAAPGRRTDTGKGDAAPTFGDVVTRELGLAERTARRFMQMAEAAKPRLKRLPVLQDWDPTLQPIGLLDAPKAEALAAGVRKLTDGQTQLEFLEELGLAKKPVGSGAKGGGAGGKKTRDAVPDDAAIRKAAREDWTLAGEKLSLLKASFTLLSDGEVEALVDYLDRLSSSMKRWVRTPLTQRTHDLVTEIAKGL